MRLCRNQNNNKIAKRKSNVTFLKLEISSRIYLPIKMEGENPKPLIKEKIPCEECDKTFTSKVDMNLHLESQHLGIIHTCDHCFHSFKLEKMLKRHIRLTHPKVQFKCQKCPRKYLLEYLLENHVKAAHLWTILNCPKCGETMTKSQLDAHQCGNITVKAASNR